MEGWGLTQVHSKPHEGRNHVYFFHQGKSHTWPSAWHIAGAQKTRGRCYCQVQDDDPFLEGGRALGWCSGCQPYLLKSFSGRGVDFLLLVILLLILLSLFG